MTEAQIENRVEHMVDVADARLMRGTLSQAEYDAELRRINRWADEQYDRNIRPHSFQAAELHSAADQAGAAVEDGSAAPATFPAPIGRRRPAIYGYDSHDIEFALHGIEQALPFALAAFRCHLENNEHVASFVDFDGFAARLSDMVADELRGPLMRRMDEMRGDR